MKCTNCGSQIDDTANYCPVCGTKILVSTGQEKPPQYQEIKNEIKQEIKEELKQTGLIRKRHGCLTTWLILMLLANSASVIIYFFASDFVTDAFPDADEGLFYLLGFLALLNVVFTIALFSWRKWGFWGFIVNSIIAFIINLAIGLNIIQSLAGFIGIALLYWVLNMGKENKAWPQLR